ncbi:cysteine peptidase family C39 domain-containing protein [Planctomycetota bacterium]
MKRKVFLWIVLVFLCEAVYADRALERSEIIAIFETLTSQPRKTWISSGEIHARHEEYRAPKVMDSSIITDTISAEVQAYVDNPNKLELTEEFQQMKLEAIPFNVRYRLSNEYTMISDVNVIYDGNRFYWEINVESRSDSIIPSIDLTDNGYTEQFRLHWNQRRIFAWDGDKYTNYFRPGGHATIEAERDRVDGPLTAGIIPWGYGWYSLAMLSNSELSGTEVESEGKIENHLTVMYENGTQRSFVLDQQKDFAVLTFEQITPGKPKKIITCDGYQLVSGKWCPSSVIVEEYDVAVQPERLLSHSVWDYVSITNGSPKSESFDVEFEYDTYIEDFRFEEPLRYRYSPPMPLSTRSIDIDELIQKRLEIVYLPQLQLSNCAATTLEYAFSKLGLNVPRKELLQLTDNGDKGTSLLKMKRFVSNKGLNGIAVKTDLAALKGLVNCQVILYLADTNHYVVLGSVDGKYVRLLDLDDNNFYYRRPIESFNTSWDGTALVLSQGAVPDDLKSVKLDEGRLAETIGAGCEQCNTECGGSGTSGCIEIGGLCGGTYSVYYSRTCCGPASSGSCTESSLPLYKDKSCGEDENINCVGMGEWTDGGSVDACG